MIDQTHDPSLVSWVESANRPAADFPIQNLPYATFRRRGEERTRVGVAIGDMVLDAGELLRIPDMPQLMALPVPARRELRGRLSEFLARHTPGADRLLFPESDVELLLPCAIPDFTDFFASLDHAENALRILRPGRPLPPNYKWMPIAYHGRASSVVATGAPVHRPWGQIVVEPDQPPVYAPSRMLDYELELGVFMGPGNAMGRPIPVDEAENRLFGVTLLNDWSARDIQSWESQPLGPFLSKNFATSISPWVVTMEALAPFRCAAPARAPGDPPLLEYLRGSHDGAFRIRLEAWLRTPRMEEPARISASDFSSMYWTLDQIVAHHASNGCPLRTGGLIGSGTVSGPARENCGCLLEVTRNGSEPLRLPSGDLRAYLEDGDEVIFRGRCEAAGFHSIGLGECRGVVLAAEA